LCSSFSSHCSSFSFWLLPFWCTLLPTPTLFVLTFPLPSYFSFAEPRTSAVFAPPQLLLIPIDFLLPPLELPRK
jgi:hypothetical protein